MARISMLGRLVTVGLILLVSGCGFSLRGSDVLAVKFSSLQLNSQQSNSEFTQLLRRSLLASDIEIYSDSDIFSTDLNDFNAGLPLLSIANEQVVTRPLTVNPRARAAQVELRLSIDIAVTLAGQFLVEPETLFVERSYFEDIENISGNQAEIEIISAEMRRELTNQLMRRLAAVEISESF